MKLETIITLLYAISILTSCIVLFYMVTILDDKIPDVEKIKEVREVSAESNIDDSGIEWVCFPKKDGVEPYASAVIDFIVDNGSLNDN